MYFANDDFLDDLNFGGPQSFDLMRKDKPEEFDPEEKNQIIFNYAPVEKPLSFFSDLKKNTTTKKLTEVKKGTTTLAFVYKSGILIAVDSRASMGSYIASKTVRKVTEINSYLLGTIAGGASDCQFWERQLSEWCKLYELRYGTRVPVTAASEVLCDWVSQYRGRGLSM
jgi:20S proteasome subunit beta 5